MPVLFLAAVVLNVLIDEVGRWAFVFLADAQALSQISDTLRTGLIVGIEAARFLIGTLVLAPVAVAVHRFILLAETSPLQAAITHRVRVFALWTMVVQLAIHLVPELVDRLWLAKMALELCALFIALRLLLIFPAIAIDAQPSDFGGRMDTSWKMTRGHFWTTVALLLFSLLPLILLEMAPGLIAAILSVPAFGGYWSDALLSSTIRFLYQLSDILGSLLVPLKIAIAAAVASWMYMWVLDNSTNRQAIPPLPYET